MARNGSKIVIALGCLLMVREAAPQAVIPSGGESQYRIVPPPGTGRNKEPFRDLFEQADEWDYARSRIDSIGYYDHAVNRFSDQELTLWFGMIQGWGKKFFLETGALNEWCTTGQACFEAVHPQWDRFLSLGATLDAFSMDEPFFKARYYGIGSDQYAVEQVADWIRLVRENYPGTAVGSIEPYPALSIADFQWWIEHLNARLADLGVAEIDYLCVDPDWRRFPQDGSWEQVKQLEDYCRSIGLGFSLIYWAADAPLSMADVDWKDRTLYQGHQYRAVGGRPDEYDMQSWLMIPNDIVPETGLFTFTRAVNDFYAQIIDPPPPTPTPTITLTRTPTETATLTPSPTLTSTPSLTPTNSPSPTSSATLTPTLTATNTLQPSDLNLDGLIDQWDLLVLLLDWSKVTGPREPVPSPSFR